VDYISAYKASFGVEPICEVLNEMEIQIAPSTYYAAIKRSPSARALSDERLVPIVRQVHAANYSCYGVRKMHRALNRLQHGLGRDQVARLMKMAGVRGRSRLRRVITTKREAGAERYPDLVKREWDNGAPDVVWVADFTHVRTSTGTVYASFLQDAGSRRILGFTVASSQSTELVLKAVEQAVSARRRFDPQFTGEGVIHHSDAGSQGGFKWSSQHLGYGGARWASRGSSGLRFRLGRGGSGRRIGLYGRRCGHRAGRSHRVRCSVSSGG